MPPPLMRLFVALPLAPPDRERIRMLCEPLTNGVKTVKWVRPEHFHITLRFLGEQSADSARQLCRIVRETATANEKMVATLSSLGAFPNVQRPRVIWGGFSSGGEAMTILATELEKNLIGDFGSADKPFKPHLTLGRVKEGGVLQDLAGRIERAGVFSLPLSVESLVLFESTLTPAGPVYREVEVAQLGKADDTLRFK